VGIDAPIRRVSKGSIFYDFAIYPAPGWRGSKRTLYRYVRLVATKGEVTHFERSVYVSACLEMTHPQLDKGERFSNALAYIRKDADRPKIPHLDPLDGRVPATIQTALVLADSSRWGPIEARWKRRLAIEAAIPPILLVLLLLKVAQVGREIHLGAESPDEYEDTFTEFLWRLVEMTGLWRIGGSAMGILRCLGSASVGFARQHAPSLLLRILRGGVCVAGALYLRFANGLASVLLGTFRRVIRLG
jgi:hypothetical protein